MDRGQKKSCPPKPIFYRENLQTRRLLWSRRMPKLKEMDRKTLPSAAIFLARRLSLCIETEERASFAARRAYLLKQHNTAWLNIFNATAAYYYALLGETEEIPEIFRTHTLFSVNILVPGKPMIEMVENQVYLAQVLMQRSSGGARDCLPPVQGCSMLGSTASADTDRGGVCHARKNRGGAGASFAGIAGGRAR